VRRDADVAEMLEFSAGYDVEAAAAPGEQFQEGEIAIRLYSETKQVRKARQTRL